LIDLGAKPAIIGPAVNLVIAQRLIRTLCPNCKVPIEVSKDTAAKIQKFLSTLPKEIQKLYKNKEIKLYSSKGCDKCRAGFKGRMGIFELLKHSGELESLIAEEVTEETIKKLAKKQGLIEMQADGILKVLEGRTTLEEVERVTGPIEWLG